MRLATLQAKFGRWLQAESAEAATALGGGPGLDVYLNNYRSQLITALESGYPQLQRWLGETAFLAAAAQHIDAAPPRAWTLDAYGADFAETIAQLYPDDPECAELAGIEAGLAAAFTTPDVAPVAIEALGAIDWDGARLRFVPSLTLLPAATNAGALWQALSADATPPPVELLPAPAVVLLWRQGFHPSFRSAEAAEAEAIGQLRAGACFGDFCASMAAARGAEAGAARAGALLGRWLQDGLITAIA